tara:strand:- start:383 stop:577 length:195 start_codon:yes stop_codon:yes gene_type:complete
MTFLLKVINANIKKNNAYTCCFIKINTLFNPLVANVDLTAVVAFPRLLQLDGVVCCLSYLPGSG